MKARFACHALSLFPFLFFFGVQATAAELKKVEECKPGLKVADRSDKAGTVVGVANGMCKVKLADGTERSYLHWMLRPAGAGKATTDRLVNGVYKCYHSGGYAFIDIHIEGPAAYKDRNGKAGKYRLDAGTGKIVFESGPLQPASAKLFDGPKIGLNMTGQNVYSTTCSLKR